MTTGDRIKLARRQMNLNQTEFGSRIGLSQAAIGGYENNSHNVAEQTLIHISKEYGINLTWLRTGEGEMFENHGDEFDEIARQLNLNDLQRRLLRMVYEMPIEYQRMIRDCARQIVDGEEPESKYDRDGRIVTAALQKYDEEHDEEDEPDEDQQHA